jgi:uncharacterized protein (DUF58 family)
MSTAAARPLSTSSDALLKRLEWTVLRRLDGQLQGNHRTLWRGGGLDLADLREYQQHDDVRHIDWNVTARLQVPHVRQFTEDRELSAWFLVDLSGSVDFGSQALTKRRVAREFVGVLARLLTRHGNRVGAILYTDQIQAVLPARGGRQQVLALLQHMDQRVAPVPAAPAAKRQGAARAEGQPAAGGQRARSDTGIDTGITQLGSLLRSARGIIKRRSSVFVVSDFISAPGWEAELGPLALRHDLTAVRLFDPLEMDLPDLGLINMTDSESGEQLVVDTSDPGFRRRYAAAAERRETALREALARAGVDTLELATDDELLDAILRFADLRKQRARLAAGGGVPAHLSSSHTLARGGPAAGRPAA